MAAPRPPRTSDGRVPCPLCGGLIHPVAGRCKHCKQDLTALRATRPAAAQLPALHANGKNGHHGNGHARAAAPVVAASPVAVTQVAAIAPSAPPADVPAAILPPRPTGRSMPAQASESPGWLRWPVIVMVLAVLAMIGAVVVMIWPNHPARADKRPPPPAADHMSTDQLPVTPIPPVTPPRAPDPWDSPTPSGPHARAVPVPPSPDTPDDTDQLGTPGNVYGGLLSAPGADVAMQLVSHLCARFTQCGIHNDGVTLYCSSMKALQQQQGGAPRPLTCDKARRCMDEVDQLSCTAKVDDAFAIEQLMMKMPDCMDALTGC